MSIYLRERPTASDKDLERFTERAEKNKVFMRDHAKRKTKEYQERLNNV